MYPECEEIMRLAPDYHIIPVCKEIYADVITPITLLRKIAAVSKRYYLLESVEGGEKKWRHFQTVQLWDRQLGIVAEHGADCVAYVKRICAEDESRGRRIQRGAEQMQIGVLKKIFVKEKTKNEKTS